jgi:hypothetical protein
MPATTAAPTTENGEAFAPVTERMHRHGKEPDGPAPTSVEELEDELRRLGSDLQEVSGILKILAERTSGEALSGCVWALEGLTSRADSRLQEACDALSQGHTDNVGERIEDVGAMALHANNALQLAWNTAEIGTAFSEYQSGGFAVASNAVDYVQERLDFLLYESDLSYLDD